MPPRKRKQAPEPEAVVSDVEPSKMKVAELKEELKKRGLETSGKKGELVSRLEKALEDDKPSPPKKAKTVTDGATAKPAKATKKAPAKKKTAKAKETPKEEPATEGGVDESDFSKAVRVLTSVKPAKKSVNRKVDRHCPGGGMYEVFGDWDCMLNQTNIGQNNNKFYVIQLLRYKWAPNRFALYTRWGRVGEVGADNLNSTLDEETGKKMFGKKFQDKTKNKWEKKDNFTAVPGKYTLLEMDDDDEDEEETRTKLAALDEPDAPGPIVKACSLDKPTQNLIKLIFDNDMFKDAMQSMEIDTKKLPLGKLSKVQIAKGFEALEAIETALNASVSRPKLAELTSKFYTIVPHDFGRRVPPVIADHETLQRKFDMLLVLGDIEMAQGLQKDSEDKTKKGSGEEVPHPLDVNYQSLKAELSHVDKKDEEFGVLEKYLRATEPQWRKLEILDVWKVDRDTAGDRFKAHDGIANRRLLWHGTNVAVVAAILKSGLRIMPHSGGRVGKGIYFASECSKSAGYVRTSSNGTGIMFLNEVALGEERHIMRDDWTLTTAPSGYHSIVAKGRTEPDSKHDTSIVLEGKPVAVPQGKPIPVDKFSTSNFSQSEYLVYKENQARIRYLLKLKFS